MLKQGRTSARRLFERFLLFNPRFYGSKRDVFCATRVNSFFFSLQVGLSLQLESDLW